VRKKPLKNVAASVRQRLLNQAKAEQRPFDELVLRYGIERFIYRLSRSDVKDHFILKGALMFSIWQTSYVRPTKDIDLLGNVANNLESIEKIMRSLCEQRIPSDGVVFDQESVHVKRIAEDADYQGIRCRLEGHLDKARIVLQIDIGFGDIVSPPPKIVEYPTLLEFPAPKLIGYSKESSIAEKFQTMIKRGELNSRMKDFYDIWHLASFHDFDGETLGTSIQKTFDNRNTEIPKAPTPLQKAFGKDPQKNVQWRAFIRKSKIDTAPEEFSSTINAIGQFLGPLADVLSQKGCTFSGTWPVGGPWNLKT